MGGKYDMGCCGSMFKCFLTLINSLFLILGVAVFIGAAVLRWGPNILNDIIGIKGIDEYISPSLINGATIFLLILGAVIIVISLVGIFGTRCMSKFFLTIYFIIILVLFVAHLVALLVLVFGKSKLKNVIDEGFDKLKDKTIKNNYTNSTECAIFKEVSGIFKCCGSYNSSDFATIVNGTSICCKDFINGTQNFLGCKDQAWEQLNSIYLTNIIIFLFYFFLIFLFFFFYYSYYSYKLLNWQLLA